MTHVACTGFLLDSAALGLGLGRNLQRPSWARLTSIPHQASRQGLLSIRALAPVGLTPTLQGHCKTGCRLGRGLESCPHRPVSVVSHSESQTVCFERGQYLPALLGTED